MAYQKSKKISSHTFQDRYCKTKDEGIPWWLRLCALTAEGLGLTPGWGARISQATWHRQKKKISVNADVKKLNPSIMLLGM